MFCAFVLYVYNSHNFRLKNSFKHWYILLYYIVFNMDMTCPMGTKLKRPPAFLTQFWHPRSGFDTLGVVLSAVEKLFNG